MNPSSRQIHRIEELNDQMEEQIQIIMQVMGPTSALMELYHRVCIQKQVIQDLNRIQQKNLEEMMQNTADGEKS